MSSLSGGEGSRKKRSDKKVNVNPALPQNVHEKLDRLSVACGITKTTLAGKLIELCLNNESIINFIQQQYREQSRFRIIPSTTEEGVKFIFAEKKKE